MSFFEKKITIDLDETLITPDYGEYKNSKPKNLFPFAEENSGYSVLKEFAKISKYKFKKGLENEFKDF